MATVHESLLQRSAVALREEARLLFDSNCNWTKRHVSPFAAVGECWAENTEEEQLRYAEYMDLARRLDGFTRSGLVIMWRPLLTSGLLGVDSRTALPIVLIDSEQSLPEQGITLWHEMLHLLGLTDEDYVERLARRLASAAPEVLPLLRTTHGKG